MALSKKNRLNSEKSFKLVFKEGKTVKNSFFFIKFFKNSIGHLRLAIAISNKIAKKSTTRNKLKRIVAEVLKNSRLYGQPLDLVIVATETIVGKTVKEIKGELEQTIDKKFVK